MVFFKIQLKLDDNEDSILIIYRSHTNFKYVKKINKNKINKQ